ncbi:uncharacterized protein [Elaeis guineensis]|uniref:Transcription factor PHYTOCHROME INTERACTING FACTOR-LIKE 13 isoform X3 n=2 Tax=Elaeis guineensis var. tenera TaxID=51953 RepID=A0A6J0PM31_ELAGV|nr:transcription factor PHYTOCHROME INTERACTING FACTOR-LIKE 13 isoform X3 [Elaeis guineensis]
MGDPNSNSSGGSSSATWSFSGPSPSSTSSSSGQHHQGLISLMGHVPPPPAVQMLLPSCRPSSGVGGGGLSLPQGQDLEPHDCESEVEGVEVGEEPAKPVPSRGSGSKRSRAAEVHNLSEKRRRSRINEKMKALQNLIPNSNKTDKASMLDEAIEYLKQLQLQVQMLSMRNGLNHPMYLFGALQPFPASQMCMGFGADNGTAMSMGVGVLPPNQDSAARNSFDPSNQSTPSHESIVIPSVKNVTNPENSCKMGPSHSQQAPFQLPVSAEIFTGDMVTRRQLAAGQTTRNLPENEMKCMAVAASQRFGGQPSSLVDDNLEECVIGRERAEDMPSKDPENRSFVQHLHGLQAGRRFPSADAKEEPLHF